MKKCSLILISGLFFLSSHAQQTDNRPAIIPEPVSKTWKNGFIKLPATTIIVATDAAAKPVAAALQNRLSVATGFKVSVTGSGNTATIRLVLNKKPDPLLGTEGYTLAVSPRKLL